jgi:hypothetical protein
MAESETNRQYPPEEKTAQARARRSRTSFRVCGRNGLEKIKCFSNPGNARTLEAAGREHVLTSAEGQGQPREHVVILAAMLAVEIINIQLGIVIYRSTSHR